MATYDQWDKLNPSEKLAVAQYPVLASVVPTAMTKATAETKRRFGYNGHNDKADAFRHCYWSALIARDAGMLAGLAFTTAHEDFPTNPPDEKAMDLHNNSKGLIIGYQHKGSTNDTVVSDACYTALTSGELKTLK